MRLQPTSREAALQHARWQRLQMHLRCGLTPEHPALIRVWLGLGRYLVRLGALDEVAAQQRMLSVLLACAGDAALPWWWRSLCLEHVDVPLARLTHRVAAPAAAEWQAAVQRARDALPVLPPAAPLAQ